MGIPHCLGDLLPLLMEVISSGNIDPMLDEIIKTPEISREAGCLPATFLIPIVYSLNLPHLGHKGAVLPLTRLGRCHIPGSYFSNIPPVSAKGFIFVR